MNCKQGDIAIVVRSFAGNEGKIVQCVAYVGVLEYLYPDGRIEHLASWRMDRALLSAGGVARATAPDSYLRPLRDNPGEDEVLRLAGRPVKTPEVVE